ncbi:MAG: hypothetical protein ACYCW6_09755 [Candidatus Xenobia bacterium]
MDQVQKLKERRKYSAALDQVECVLTRKPGLVSAIGQKAHLLGVYDGMTAAFPDFNASRETFRAIYPLHPATLGLLGNLMHLFSRHRGVVDFVHTQIAGDPVRQVVGLLDAPPDQILTCEAIFDHFSERLRELPDTSAYITVAWRYFQQHVPDLFDQPLDRELALRVLKVLILLELSPLEKDRSVRRLAYLTSRAISQVDPKANALYLKERILDRLVAESTYLARVGEDGYRIDLNANTGQLLQARVRDLVRGLDAGPDFWMRLLRLVHQAYLPFAELSGGQVVPRYLYWQYTRRTGTVLLGDLRNVAPEAFLQGAAALESTDRDWMLMLGTPQEPEHQDRSARALFEHVRGHRFAPLILAWLPRAPRPDHLQTCLTVLAQHQLLEQSRQEGSSAEALAAALEPMVAAGLSQVREIIAQCYQDGEVLTAAGTILAPSVAGTQAFDKAILHLISPTLERLYPLHSRIHPDVAEHREEDLERLWRVAILPGSIDKSRATQEHVEHQLDGIAVRLGLMRKTRDEYSLSVDMARHALLEDILEAIVPGQQIPFASLAVTFRKGSWGLLRHLFILCLATLAHQGFCTLYREGRAVGHEDLKRLLAPGGIDAVGEGRILDREQRERLDDLAFLAGPDIKPATLSLASQRDLWQRVVAGSRALRAELDGLQNILQSHRGYQSFALLPHAAIQQALDTLAAVLGHVHSSRESRDGLSEVLEQVTPEAIEAHRFLVRWRNFLTSHLADFQHLHRALTLGDFPVPEAHADLGAMRTRLREALSQVGDLVAQDRWGELWEGFQQFRDAYAEVYRTAHNQYYASPHFKDWPGLRFAPEMQLLERFGRLYALQVEDPAAAICRAVETAPRPCRADVREGIVLAWQCTCNYRLGQELSHPTPDELRARMRSALAEYERALGEAEVREKLEAHADTLQRIGRQELATRLAELLVACRRGRLGSAPRQGLQLLTETMVEELNRALAGRALLVDRSINALTELLADRILPPARLRDAFEKWLGQIGGDTLIRVVTPAAAPDDAASLVRRTELSAHLPEMSADELVGFISRETTFRDLVPSAWEQLVSRLVHEGPELEALRQWRVEMPDDAFLETLELLACPVSLPAYLKQLCRLPLQLDRLSHAAFHGLPLPSYALEKLQAEAARHLAGLEGCGWETDPELIPMGEVVSRLGAARGVILIVDAMRWDLWMALRPVFEAALSAHRWEGVYPVRCEMPTRTQENRRALLGDRPFTLIAAAEKAAKRAEVLHAIRHATDLAVLHVNLIDERLHDATAGPHVLYQTWCLEMQELVTPYLSAVPPEVPVLITADHGFVYDGTWHHGGGSIFERVVPAARWLPVT